MGLIGRLHRKYCGPVPGKQTKTGNVLSLNNLKEYYEKKWLDAYLLDMHRKSIEFRLDAIIPNENLYKTLGEACKTKIDFYVPWFVGALLHYRESGNKFNGHMHNGDPLTARTTHVPKGRPITGKPPFTFEDSFVDAMLKMKTSQVEKWDIPTILWFCERYNGFGYYRRGLTSPYVWSWTNNYKGGMYTADGKFDSSKWDPRPGVAAFLKYMLENCLIKVVQ